MDDILAKQAYIQQNMPKKDPFDQGIMRAVKSAKQSLDMDDDQSDRAMRESMATFAENIAPMPKVKGFMANFAQVGRALSPAIQTHDAYEDQAKEKNKQMIAYAQQLRAAEEAKAAALEGNAYSREMADKQMALQQQQLAEQREYHRLSLDAARAKAEAKIEAENYKDYLKELEKEEKNPIKNIYGQPYHKMDAVERRAAEKLRTTTGNTKLAYDNAKKSKEAFLANSPNNLIRPVGGFMTRFANPVKEGVGLAIGNQSLKDEAALRNRFKAELGNVTVMLEVAKTGKSLTQGMYDRLKENFPDVDRDSLESIEEKMKYLNEEIDLYTKAAKLSSEYGVKINPDEVDTFEAHIKANAPNDNNYPIQQQNNDFIKVISPSGIVGEISKNNLADAIKDGYKEVSKSSENNIEPKLSKQQMNVEPTSFRGDFDIPNQDGYQKDIMPLFRRMR